MIPSTSIPDAMLKRVSAESRKLLGVKTSDEAIEAFCARSEKELQVQMANLLRQRGIWFYNARMDRKTTSGLGTPDFLFSVGAHPIAVEVKHESRKLRPEQKKCIAMMLNNGWHCYLVRRLDQFRDLLNLYQSATATATTNIEREELEA